MFCTIARIFVLSTETIGSNLISFVGTSPTLFFHKKNWYQSWISREFFHNLQFRFVKRSYISISLHFCESWTHVNIHHWDSFTLKNCYFIARLCSFYDFNLKLWSIISIPFPKTTDFQWSWNHSYRDFLLSLWFHRNHLFCFRLTAVFHRIFHRKFYRI